MCGLGVKAVQNGCYLWLDPRGTPTYFPYFGYISCSRPMINRVSIFAPYTLNTAVNEHILNIGVINIMYIQSIIVKVLRVLL
jgi:hypothetical protein